ncbi:MAG: 5'/3'-nucleotidase SurE, partial [Candidatus Bathyarchaeia archaeon]
LDSVFCIIPSRQRSAVSKSLIFHKPLRLDYAFLGKKRIYHLSGTPADCVLFALNKKNFMPKKPSLLLSGVNMGSNISIHSIFSSGTLGACFEAATYGIPSLAFSQHIYYKACGARKRINQPNELKRKLVHIIQKVLKCGMPSGCSILNINFPRRVKDAKIAVCSPSMHRYAPSILERKHPYGTPYYWIVGKDTTLNFPNTDASLLKKGFITITPLSLDISPTRLIKHTKELFIGL